MRARIFVWAFLVSVSFSANSQTKERIGVTRFEILSDKETSEFFQWMSLGFAETLTDAFSRVDRFTVIERTQLEKVIKEQKSQRNENFDSSSMVKAGKILGVSKILVGSCQIITGHIMVNIRIVNVETGEIIPIVGLPIVKKIDSVLFVQKEICIEILQHFGAYTTERDEKTINIITSKSTKNIKAYEFLAKGIELYDQGFYNQALSMFNTAIDYDKRYRKAYYRRGATKYAMSEYGEAAKDFSQSTTYLPMDSVYHLMGKSYFKAGDPKKAEKYLSKAYDLNPSNVNVLLSLASLHQKRNDQSNARSGIEISSIVVPFAGNEKIISSSIDTDPTGDVEIVYEYFAGIAKARSKNKYGFKDTAGNVVVPFIYDEVRNFTWGFAAYRIGNKWGYLSHSGLPLVEAQYVEVSDFTGAGIGEVRSEKGWGIVNSKGVEIIRTEYEYLSTSSLSKLVFARKKVDKEYLWAIYDEKGKQIAPPIYTDHNFGSYTSGYNFITIAYKGKWGVIDHDNKIIVPFRYEDKNAIRDFDNGFAAIRVNGRWGFINLSGQEVVKPIFDNVKSYRNGFFEVKQKGSWGLIDSTATTTLGFNYDDIKFLKHSYWAVKKGIKWAILDAQSKTICKFLYDEIGNGIVEEYVTYSNRPGWKKSKLVVPAKVNDKIIYVNEKCECVMDCK